MPKPTEVASAGPLFLAGLALTGAGLGLQAASLFRLSARVGLGTPWDTAIFGLVGLGLIGLGALFFGPLVRTRGRSGWILAAIAATGVSVLSLAVVAATTAPLGFKAHCARFGFDASLAGTPLVNATAGLVMLILPGFGIGALLAAGRRWREILTLLAGLAIGWASFPFAFELMDSLDGKSAGSAGLVLHGAILAGVGIALGARATRTTARLWILAGVGLAGSAALLPITAIVVFPPWQRFALQPLDLFETAQGQYTVLPAGNGGRQLLLDQRAISPNADGLRLEAACLQRTVEVLGKSVGTWPPRTLVVGLVTPERADLLAALGFEHFDRTALWFDDLDALETAAGWDAPAPGRRIAPSDLPAAGPYDLALTFPTGAYAAAGWDLRLLAAVQATAKVAWLPGDVGMQAAPDDARLILASNGLERFAFGWIEGVSENGEAPACRLQPLSFAWMSTRPEARPIEVLRGVAEEAEPALALHAAAQRISSPFESPLEQVEVEPAALAHWRDRALGSPEPPDFYLRGVLEGAGAVLMAQGEVPWVFEYLAPVADRFPDSIGLQVVLAWAEAEELQFEAAAARLRVLVDDHSQRRDLRIALADALIALDDPEGRGIARELLRDDPENPRLFGLAQGVRGMTTLGTPGGYESLSQEEARALADGAVLGTITGISVQEVDPGDGAPLYLTTLSVSGTKLASPTDPGAALFEDEAEHEVTFLGGFTDPEHGSFNSIAPPAHRTRPGRQIFYYYQSQDDIAGGTAGHALLRGRAGLFTAFETRAARVIVQGRGNAAAIPYNLVRDELNAPH